MYREKQFTYVVNKAKTSCTGIEESTSPVTPTQSSNGHRDEQTESDDEVDVPSVLPPHNRVLAQVTNVGNANLVSWLENHPAHMCPKETTVCVVRVELGVGVAVVSTVSARPPLDGAFNGTCAGHGQEVLEREGRVVGAVSPETVITGSYTCTK